MHSLENILQDPFLGAIAASLVAAVLYESVIKRINYKMILNIFVSVMKAFFKLLVSVMKAFLMLLKQNTTD